MYQIHTDTQKNHPKTKNEILPCLTLKRSLFKKAWIKRHLIKRTFEF